ncbi:glycoside hydrolase family protein [Acidithiobacillus sp. VAN18-1]|jgi:lysozyme|uniref:Lysozyme n=1 Tax=Igneacidithiobacillus copahuensis TaxID=2724909 RepID=A0AAE2YN73_9PROT|nr:glycoside hydrolase family protein [Igneacidithiobacillus copahuensis]MBU2787247.1 glycoside hydrolase family protein [Igneacidithiobacillus copahuensis]MBU2795837.1 glycoside hydrolase family protein [Acidithiobacillus sp. VAN18-2]MBU2796626.1 glycoside hydrolase family protein [Acidithiobacillus sp. VAN18-2]MBU2797574.1 glycoside hydrolase family protein [Acidithiobacillus sp. VAN18-2]
MLEDQLERQESYRRFVYDDATGQEIVPGYTVQGNPTIGYGRDLMTEGILKEEAMVLLRHDIDRAWREVTSHLPWAESQLSVIRFAVLVNMAFNMGLQGLLGFTQMLSALQAGNYEQAAKAMLDSLWYQQTGSRAQALAEQMRTNRWQDTDTPSSTQA